MYRNKSSVSLRGLAHSLKQSITLDRHKAHSRQFKPLRSSASTINLPSNKNPLQNKNCDENYLIMLQTRKSKLSQMNTDAANRESNYSQVRYDIKETKQLMQQRKQRLLQMTRTQSTRRFPIAQARNAMPLPAQHVDQVTSTLSILQQQHSRIKKNIQQKMFSSSLKSYNKYIDESQTLAKQLKQISVKYEQFTEYKRQLNNRLMFLQEQMISTQMNFSEQLAQKQYCEEFLYQYQHQNQFKQEAQNVMKLIELQYLTKNNIQQQKFQLQSRLTKLQSDFKQWKIEENIELKQKRFENKLKQHRIQLMKIEQDLDSLTQQLIKKFNQQNLSEHPIRKVREYICSFFKKYNQLNINHISHAQIADGIDIFLCKQGLIKDFTLFVCQKTQTICLLNGMYSLKLSQYCDCLKKIQNLFNFQKTQLNKVIAMKFEEQIISTKNHIQSLTIQRQKNLAQIQVLKENIDKILAQDSLSMIELLSKKDSTQFCFNKQDGFFNLSEIKTRVKQMKFQQLKRINRVKEVFLRLKMLQERQLKFEDENKKNIERFRKETQTLNKQIQIWTKKVNQISIIKQGYQSKKEKCDKLIDEAVTKMKQKDQSQQQLRALEMEIQKLKKQKIQSITQKHQTRTRNQNFINFQQTKSNLRPFSSVTNFTNLNDCLKNTWCKKMDSFKVQNKLKLQPHKITEKERKNQTDDENLSAEFRVTRNLHPSHYRMNADEQKISNRTQSSPKNIKQRFSLGALNSILLSKCNLIESKNIETKPRPIKKSASTYGLAVMNKENEPRSEQLLLESNAQSLRNSKKSKKQNPSRKTSTSKNTQRNTLKQQQDSNRNTAKKLSLSTATRKPSVQKSSSQSKQNPYNKTIKPKPVQRDINSIISNKLLRR